tara:strand:- start:1396 stop:1638 length:243 start_codon:yes stop_codon:yes gene_type:complete
METEIVANPSFWKILLTSPLTYIILLIIGVTIFELKKPKSAPKAEITPKKTVTKKPTKKSTKKPTKKTVKKAVKKSTKKS